MPGEVPDYEDGFREAIASFWDIKSQQQTKANDAGTSNNSMSGGVLGGKHMDAFEPLIATIVRDAGITADLADTGKIDLPGYYREIRSTHACL